MISGEKFILTTFINNTEFEFEENYSEDYKQYGFKDSEVFIFKDNETHFILIIKILYTEYDIIFDITIDSKYADYYNEFQINNEQIKYLIPFLNKHEEIRNYMIKNFNFDDIKYILSPFSEKEQYLINLNPRR